jgi:calcineurin-like phosphoesterase family protein
MRALFGWPKAAFAAILATVSAILAIAVLGSYGGRSAEAASGVTMVGAGDIASCSSSGDEATARLLAGIRGTVFTTGDNAYESGTPAQFTNCYRHSWGRHKGRTKPTPGNHEYHTRGASGYFNYFGAAAGKPGRGYYSYNRGSWHVVALNSMCERVGGCRAKSTMVRWLKRDLAANPKKCTLAYFHHPLFSSGEHGNYAKMRPTWRALHAANADVVVSGHDHSYERFAPQRPDGTFDRRKGIRQFVVGTGGASLYGFENVKRNSQVRNANTYGVLKLTLNMGSYGWKFVPVAGKTFTDSGTTSCH